MFTGMIPALATPFRGDNQEVDIKAFEKLVCHVIEGGADGVVVAGTTGEMPTLSEEEIDSLTSAAFRHTEGKVSLIVGTGTNATKKSVEATKRAKDLGADGALVIVPYGNKPTFQGVVKHFEAFSEADLPVILYHHPGRTGITLDLLTLSTIVEFPHVVAIKDCSKNLKDLSILAKKTVILSGDDESLLETLKVGGRGIISVIGNLLPKEWKEIVTLGLMGNFIEGKKRFQEILPLIQAINLEVNPQGIKCALALYGLCENSLRLPMIPASHETEEEIKGHLLIKSGALETP